MNNIPTNALYYVDYGDGSIISKPQEITTTNLSFQYIYPASGVYDFVFTAFNDISNNSYTTKVNIATFLKVFPLLLVTTYNSKGQNSF